jgi:hypothetical protein
MLKNKNQQEKLTYLLNRACEYCGERIADQAHSARIHCEHEINDGIIKDCKTAKARENDSEERKYFENRKSEIKGIDKRIALMYEKKGENVNLQDLEAYDIHLDKPSELSCDKNGQFTCKYYLYSIHFNPLSLTYKIIKND